MRRIAILGCSGGGKSTLARALGAKLNLPVVHLDRLYWLPGWVERDEASFRALQSEALSGERWVVDGGYSTIFDLRLPRVDTVVLVDQPRWLCLWRVFRRRLAHPGRTRIDLGEGCPEKVDWAFITYIWTYYRLRAPERDAAVAALALQARIVRLRSDRQIRAFLATA